ncbi:MAG TPA: aldolase [Bacteroides sp.]|nr:aldolase [Bacteroides sp.]
MNGKELKSALRAGKHVYGTAILSPSSIWPKAVASIGLDFVFIDTEHTPLNRETVSNMCQVYNALDLAPLVRIPSPDPYEASMAIDGGAAGIIAPYIETNEQVNELVGAVKYKPIKGKKLQNRSKENSQLGTQLSAYLEENNSSTVLILNIESVPAIEALDEILAVNEVDAVLIGPHDLSCSLGIPEQYDHPLFKESVNTILKKARNKSVGAGIHIFYTSGFQQEKQWAKEEANLIVHSSDILAFKNTLQREFFDIKEFLEQSPQGTENETLKI